MTTPDANDPEVEHKIAEWHDGAAPGLLLHEYLGWTWEQYRRWAETQPKGPRPRGGRGE